MFKDICHRVAVVFKPSPERYLVTRGAHVTPILRLWHPDFTVASMRADSQVVDFFLWLASLCALHKSPEEPHNLTVFSGLKNTLFLKAYRNLHPGRKVVLRLHDPLTKLSKDGARVVAGRLSRLIRNGTIQGVSCFSQRDVQKLRQYAIPQVRDCLRYAPNGVDPEGIQSYATQSVGHLGFFVGHELRNGQRLAPFRDILRRAGLLYPGMESFIRLPAYGGPLVDYKTYLRELGRSLFALDSFRVDRSEGFSYRVAEALYLGKKLITNRDCIRDLPVYDSSRFFILGVDDPGRFPEFLACEFKPLSIEERETFAACNIYAPFLENGQAVFPM